MTVPIHAVVRLAAVSGLPEDIDETTWSFLAADDDPTTLDGIADSIISWFNTTDTHADIASYISGTVSRASNAHAINFYDLTGHLDGSAAGSPIHVVPWTLDAATSVMNFPGEVAIRQTVNADGYADVPETAVNPSPPPVTIRPRARYRGGFYLGPLNVSCTVTSAGTTEPRVNTDFLDDADGAWFRFMDERGGDFAVWSRADADLKLVAPDGLITVDNAFDTIRKRGQRSTARRTVWP